MAQELENQFKDAIQLMKQLLLSSVVEEGGVPAPSVFMITRRTPKVDDTLFFKEVGTPIEKAPSVITVLSPFLVSTPGEPVIAEAKFWELVHTTARDSRAYAVVVGMECGLEAKQLKSRGAFLATKCGSDYQAFVSPIAPGADRCGLGPWQYAGYTDLASRVRRWLEGDV
jgi:hypothetical protein